MITVVRTDDWTFNLVGVDNGGFCLQGNLDLVQLKELRHEIDIAIKNASKK